MLAHTPSKASQLRCLPKHQQQRFKAPRFQHRHRRAHTVSTRAQMGGLLDTVVTWGALAAGAGAVAYSIFYDWKPKQRPKQQQQQQDAPLFGPPDNMSWAVMGVVSCIPFFNYMVGVCYTGGVLQKCMHAYSTQSVSVCCSGALRVESKHLHACMHACMHAWLCNSTCMHT
jgi:hypothetical protein